MGTVQSSFRNLIIYRDHKNETLSPGNSVRHRPGDGPAGYRQRRYSQDEGIFRLSLPPTSRSSHRSLSPNPLCTSPKHSPIESISPVLPSCSTPPQTPQSSPVQSRRPSPLQLAPHKLLQQVPVHHSPRVKDSPLSPGFCLSPSDKASPPYVHSTHDSASPPFIMSNSTSSPPFIIQQNTSSSFILMNDELIPPPKFPLNLPSPVQSPVPDNSLYSTTNTSPHNYSNSNDILANTHDVMDSSNQGLSSPLTSAHGGFTISSADNLNKVAVNSPVMAYRKQVSCVCMDSYTEKTIDTLKLFFSLSKNVNILNGFID